jgi:hypothetical protein
LPKPFTRRDPGLENAGYLANVGSARVVQMSMLAAIDLAVRLELLRTKAAHANLGNYTRIMGGDATAGLEFTVQTMQVMLQGVAMRLRVDTPPWIYSWPRSDIQKCLNANREGLIGLIASDTMEAKGES